MASAAVKMTPTDELEELERLMRALAQSERERLAAHRRLVKLAEQARAGSVRLRQELPDLFS